jgi:hypothetical protein
MAAWLLPAVKLILPHVGTIVAAAKPHFTKRKEVEAADTTSVMQQQIAELQAAATQNAASVQELAQQLQLTVRGVEEAAAAAHQRAKRLYTVSVVSIVFAVAALAMSIVALLTH